MTSRQQYTGLIIVNTTRPLKVGMNRSVVLMAPALEKMGVSVEFLATGHIGRFLWSFLRLVWRAGWPDFDFVLFNSSASVFPRWHRVGVWVLRFVRWRGLPTYFYWHETDWALDTFKEKAPRTYQQLQAIFSEDNGIRHLTASQAVTECLERRFRITRATPIYECTEVPAVNLSEPMEPRVGPIILNLASVQMRKGPDLFIETAQKTLEKTPDAQFIWLGDGPNYDEVKKKVAEMGLADRIQFRGFDWNQGRLLRMADVLFLASRDDPFPLAVLEAMSLGKPVVAFDAIGSKEVLKDYGHLVPAFDTARAAEVITEIVERGEPETLRLERQRVYRERFTPEALAKSLAIVLEHDLGKMEEKISETSSALPSSVAPPLRLQQVFWGARLAFVIVFASAGLRYLTTVALARWMSVADYGVYSYVNAWLDFFALIATLGLSTAAARFLPEFMAKGAPGLYAGFVRFANRTTFVVSGLLALFLVPVVLFGLDTEKWHDHQGDILFGLLLIPAFSFIKLYTEMARVTGQVFTAYFHPLILRQVFLLLGAAAFVFGVGSFTAREALLTLLGSFVLIAAIQMRMVRVAQAKIIAGHTPIFESSTWLKVSAPLLMTALFGFLINQTDVLMLGSLLSVEDVGLYNAAARTSSLVTFPLFAVNAAVGPEISHLMAQRKFAELQHLVWRACVWTFLPAAAIGGLLLFFGHQILGLFGPHFTSSVPELLMLAGAYTVTAAFGVVNSILALTGKEIAVLKVFAFGAILNIACNFLLVGAFGVIGAASATALTMISVTVILYFVTRVETGLRSFIFAGSPKS